jgi:hypothetical protein
LVDGWLPRGCWVGCDDELKRLDRYAQTTPPG